MKRDQHNSMQMAGEGNGNPPQYSCLDNPMDRGAWQATVDGVAKSQTRLSNFTSLTSLYALSWRRKWLPTPVLLPGESHGQKNLVGHGPWGHKELDTTEMTEHARMHAGSKCSINVSYHYSRSIIYILEFILFSDFRKVTQSMYCLLNNSPNSVWENIP